MSFPTPTPYYQNLILLPQYRPLEPQDVDYAFDPDPSGLTHWTVEYRSLEDGNVYVFVEDGCNDYHDGGVVSDEEVPGEVPKYDVLTERQRARRGRRQKRRRQARPVRPVKACG